MIIVNCQVIIVNCQMIGVLVGKEECMSLVNVKIMFGLNRLFD